MLRRLAVVALLWLARGDGPRRLSAGRAMRPVRSGKAIAESRRGIKKTPSVVGGAAKPSFRWAVLHNWMYFLSLGLCIPVLPRVIATAVNPDGSSLVSARSSKVGGDVEGVDKILTFLTVGALGTLSDHVGRKPLIALSAFGYAATVALQLSSQGRLWRFYAADAVDGATSCMNAVCSAYVVDATTSPDKRAVAVGVFQGLSAAGAFIVGFPLSGVLGKTDPRKPMKLAVALQLVNGVLALFVTPESVERKKPLDTFDLAQANPLSALRLLFGGVGLFRVVAAAYALAWTANLALNTTFVNFVNKVFGWGPQQSGPLLVLVGFVLAVFPRIVVPRLGLDNSVKFGAIVYTLAFASIGLATTPPLFFAAILCCGLGAVVVPALVASLASRASDDDRGRTLGALQTLQELCSALAYPLYGRVFAAAITYANGSHLLLAAPFYLAALFCLATLIVYGRLAA